MIEFDPNATPECDSLLLDYADIKGWIALAGEQEIKARIAEEKLRIAKQLIDDLCNTEREVIEAMAKIEEVGK